MFTFGLLASSELTLQKLAGQTKLKLYQH